MFRREPALAQPSATRWRTGADTQEQTCTAGEALGQQPAGANALTWRSIHHVFSIADSFAARKNPEARQAVRSLDFAHAAERITAIGETVQPAGPPRYRSATRLLMLQLRGQLAHLSKPASQPIASGYSSPSSTNSCP